ncbi:MAG: glycosyltransferase family 4 protein [Bacteroidales bacterium]|nr:glycosyltransferase family 4 protein [Bacteroidales bacterium]
MKIAYMMGSLNRGGAEVLMLDLFRNAKEARLEILGIHRNKGDLYEDFLNTGWPLLQIRPKHMFDLCYLFYLRRIIIKNHVLLIHAQHPVDGFYAKMACIFTKTKLVMTLHGFSLQKPWWYRIMLRYLLKKSDMLLFVSKVQKEHYRNTYYSFPENRCKIIYNSVDTGKFARPISSDIRDELRLPANQLLLGSVGNFNSGRDQLTICHALKLLKDEQIDFSFIFIGARQAHDPSLYDRCVDYCREHALDQQVFFLGTREDVPSLLQQINAFVYSSRHDTFGIAVVEALISGTPVIVNDWKVMLEVTDNGHHALVYKSGDTADLLQKLLAFVNNSYKYKQKALEQKHIISKLYDIHTYLQKLKTTYENIC